MALTDTTAGTAIVLLSGGLDSATTLAIARERGLDAFALSFDYGQRHRFELDSARRIAKALGAREHRILEIDLRVFGGSALTSEIEVPKDRSAAAMSADDIPITYVPARNTIFLSLALAWAETVAAGDIFIGVNAVDYSGYPDCRLPFIQAFERLANLATKSAVEGTRVTIRTPLIHMTKAQIIRRGLDLGVDYALTQSCYDPDAAGRPCLRCDACRIRAEGFREAGVADPLVGAGPGPISPEPRRSTRGS